VRTEQISAATTLPLENFHRHGPKPCLFVEVKGRNAGNTRHALRRSTSPKFRVSSMQNKTKQKSHATVVQLNFSFLNHLLIFAFIGAQLLSYTPKNKSH